MISALILEEITWKIKLKCGLLCKNKIVTIFLLVFLTPQNGTYLKNTPHIYIYIYIYMICVEVISYVIMEGRKCCLKIWSRCSLSHASFHTNFYQK